jgi:monoamine oxidase
MQHEQSDVIVVGAGAAGLMAAWELMQTGRSVLVLEAKERAGGRMFTVHDPLFDLPVELGAEFVHGNLELTQMILKKAKLEIYEVKGQVWRKEKGKLQKSDFVEDESDLNKKLEGLEHDLSVKDFLATNFPGDAHEKLRNSLTSYVEGYYAADPSRASTIAMRDELQQSDDAQYRIEGGYEKLVRYLYNVVNENQPLVVLSTPVQQIKWKRESVQVISGTKVFSAKKVLITVSLGVLQAGSIHFTPALPHIDHSLQQLGFGPVIKILLQFHSAFWKDKDLLNGKDLSKLGFLFSEEKIPTWWTYFPKDAAMITGWVGGPNAAQMSSMPDEEILNAALYSLSNILSVPIGTMRHFLKSSHVSNWSGDLYVCGGYAFDTVNGKQHREVIRQPIDNTVFFGGEGLHEGVEIGTVEAALVNGREAAHRIVASF